MENKIEGKVNPVNADTLGGKYENELSVSKAADSDTLGGYGAEHYVALAVSYTNEQIRKAAPRNLMDNSDFRNPVNQRGQTSYTSSGYTIDRWKTTGSTVNIINGAIEIVPVVKNNFQQFFNIDSFSYGKKLTFVVNTNKGPVFNTVDIPERATIESENSTNNYGLVEIYGYRFYIRIGVTNNEITYVRFDMYAVNNETETIHLYNAALYEGEYTAETLPEYQPKGYGAELAECQRYYQHFNELRCSGYVTSSAKNYYMSLFLPVQMRITPSVASTPQWLGRTANGYSAVSGSNWINFTKISVDYANNYLYIRDTVETAQDTNNTIIVFQVSNLSLSADL